MGLLYYTCTRVGSEKYQAVQPSFCVSFVQKNNINVQLKTCFPSDSMVHSNETKVRKGAKIRNRYNQVPHLTQDTNGKVSNSQLYTTNESQEVSPFPAGDHKAHINRRAQRHSKHKIEQKHKKSTK